MTLSASSRNDSETESPSALALRKLRRVRQQPSFKLLILVLVFLACSPPEQPHKLVKLPSGRQVKVLSVGKMYFSKGEPALMLKYQTDLPIGNAAALDAEADDIWQSFKEDVERAHLSNAIISATSHATRGFISESRSYNFVYQKSAGGTWQRLANK